MNWVVEQPIPILFIGAFFTAIATAVWIQLRSRAAAVTLGCCLLFSGLWLLTEKLVVTHAEEVEATIFDLARALESNEPSRVKPLLQLIDPQQQQQIQQALRLATIEAISVKRNLTVEVIRRRDHGLSAEARFNAVARIRPRRGPEYTRTVPRFVILRLRRTNRAWVVVAYELRMPIGQ